MLKALVISEINNEITYKRNKLDNITMAIVNGILPVDKEKYDQLLDDLRELRLVRDDIGKCTDRKLAEFVRVYIKGGVA